MGQPEPEFTQVDLTLHRAPLMELNVEYMRWAAAEMNSAFNVSVEAMLGIDIAAYAAETLDKACGDRPPAGAFYLISQNGAAAGMGGLRRLDDAEAEIKRIYVRPGFRGRALGRRLVERLLNDARGLGYRRVLLETAPFMKSAHRIYEQAGFRDRGPYPGIEAPQALVDQLRFMEIAL